MNNPQCPPPSISTILHLHVDLLLDLCIHVCRWMRVNGDEYRNKRQYKAEREIE
jgi:hypothetical protein